MSIRRRSWTFLGGRPTRGSTRHEGDRGGPSDLVADCSRRVLKPARKRHEILQLDAPEVTDAAEVAEVGDTADISDALEQRQIRLQAVAEFSRNERCDGVQFVGVGRTRPESKGGQTQRA